jgi:hypothetical protein
MSDLIWVGNTLMPRGVVFGLLALLFLFIVSIFSSVDDR